MKTIEYVPEKSENYLMTGFEDNYHLRFATIVECRPTTHLDEIRKVVRNTGIREGMFMEHYEDDSAEKKFKI